ncbi:SixA phosphatase family protein [Schlesneria sp. T3-172]|uniref:SixA phosphatase family protein n=1 Tax=Schlesneria sphaerica TaxID=3373610 RepID=UPI0037CC1E5A
MTEKKSLLLFRHAKSSWGDPQLADQDRPLNDRGRKAAVRMGRLMKEEQFIPDLVLSSTSRRTRETAELAFAELAPVSLSVHYLDELYEAEPAGLAAVLSRVSELFPAVLLLGHNPGFEEFLTLLTGEHLKFPTAAIAVIELGPIQWSEFSNLPSSPPPKGRLQRLWKPKELDRD